MPKFFGKSNDKSESGPKLNNGTEKTVAVMKEGPPAMPSEGNAQGVLTADSAVLPSAAASSAEQSEPLSIPQPKKRHLLDSVRPVSKLAAPERRSSLLNEYADLLQRQDDPKEGDGERLKELMDVLGLTLQDVEHDAQGAAKLAESKRIIAAADANLEKANASRNQLKEYSDTLHHYRQQIPLLEKEIANLRANGELPQKLISIESDAIAVLQSSHPRIFGRDDPHGLYANARNANANHEIDRYGNRASSAPNASSKRIVQSLSGNYHEE